MAPIFRADHVGSLLRPKGLVEARKNAIPHKTRLREELIQDQQTSDDVTSTNRATPPDEDPMARLKTEQDAAIKDVVSEQLTRHVLPITTGEYERAIFYGNFFEALSGFEMRYTEMSGFKTDFPTNRPLIKWGVPGREAGYPTSSHVKWVKSAYLDDWLYLRSLLPKEKWPLAKMTVPTPSWYHVQLKEPFDKTLYADDASLLSDIAAALRQEILTLYDQGLRNVQVDDPNLSFFCDEVWVDTCAKEGVDLDHLLELYIKAHNDAVAGLPADLNVGVHICRGNLPKGVGVASGGYEHIARKIFTGTHYRAFYLEFDSPRAGDFSPLKHLPIDKAVVLGVVTTKAAEMEELDDLKARVYQAAEVIARGQGEGRTKEDALRDNLAVSPQCGFASMHEEGGVGMTMERMFEKLNLVRRLSEEIWPGWNQGM